MAANSKPSWWTAEDDDAAESYVQVDLAGDYRAIGDNENPDDYCADPEVIAGMARVSAFIDLHASKWTCRRCRYWESNAGEKGQCHGPELACGCTRSFDACEQFSPRDFNAQLQPQPKPVQGELF